MSATNQHSNDLISVRLLLWAVALGGLAVFLWAAAQLPLARLDGRYALICLFTVGLGSRIVVDIQILKSNFSVSDVFLILTALIFGPEAAIVLAWVEAFCTSLRFAKMARFRLFNAGVMVLSIAAGTKLATYWFGELTVLVQEKLSTRFLVALLVLSLTHYGVNVGLIAAGNALRSQRSWWSVWREHYAWMFIAYLASGSIALLLANFINRWSFNAFFAALPIVGVIYFGYRSYQRQLEATQQQIEEAQQHLHEMAESEERFRGAFGEAPIGMALAAPDGRWLQVNRSLCDLLGYAQADFVAAQYQTFAHSADVVNLHTMVGQVLQEKSATQQGEIRFFHKSGQEVWTTTSLSLIKAGNGAARLIFQVQDITARRQAEQKLRHAAFYDELTGLGNRRYFTDALREALQVALKSEARHGAMVFIDLHRFRLVNERLGQAAGDQLLVMVARRLESGVAENYKIARLGGDEFTILLEGIRDETEALSFVEQLRELLAGRFVVSGQEVFVNANIGLAFGQASHTTPEEWLRDAAVALQQAKVNDNMQYAVFDQAMHERALAQIQMEIDIRHALERQEFFPVYQPIMCLQTNRLVGFECLVRWQHPQRGLISPLDFIPLAEETGHIIALGKFILNEACRQLRRWQDQFASELPLTMSVNVSGKQVMRGHLVEQVLAVLAETGIAPHHLKLEMTESVMLDNLEVAAGEFKQLRALGVQLSMDDFGTGYSSLSYLHRLPISTLKIDRSFVTPVAEKTESAAIVQTIILLANSLGLEVIAEGIETFAQLEKLREFGCGNGQGYFFSKPLKVDEAGSLLRDSFNTTPRVTHLLRPQVPGSAPLTRHPRATRTHQLELAPLQHSQMA